MSITAAKKQSDLEKRLRLLRQQVYGTDKKQAKSEDRQLTTDSYSIISDTSYLYQDLLKIGMLATCAIGMQIILFILTKNHILNLNFF